MIGLLGFAALWALGRWRGWGERWLLAAAFWWVLLIVAHLPIQVDNPLARFTGGDFEGWLVLGVLAGLVLGYRQVLRVVRGRRKAEEAAPAPSGAFRPAELDRYARHIMLREIGGPGQRRLKDAKVLVIGAGGLGSPALLYLAGAGVGVLGFVDDDEVDGSNLQRQIIHADARIGMPKVFSAEVALRGLNPFIELRPYRRRLDEETARALFAEYDLILDGTDNFDTRYMVNRVAVELGKPLISAAITQWEGQVSLFHPAGGAPCYECVFPVRPAPGMVPTCAEAGVAAPLPGVIGAIMAMEAVKHVTGAGETLRGRLMIHDALYAETRVIGVQRREGCAVCGGPSS